MPQAWQVTFHRGVVSDLQSLGVAAARVLKIIEPLKDSHLGDSLGPELPGCRLYRSDGFHILYQVDSSCAQVFVLAVRQESDLTDNGGQKVKTHRGVG